MEDPEGYFSDNIEDLMRTQGLKADEDLCGFMIETFQGWSAAFYPAPFVKALERLRETTACSSPSTRCRWLRQNG